MGKQTSVQQSVDMITEFLGPIRAQAQKEAEHASFSGSTPQTTLGNEQSQAAKDSGSTAPDEKKNSEADAQQAADTQGTQTLTIDDKVREKGNIGPVSETEINQEQKMARASRLGNEILHQIEASLDKRATAASDEDDEVNKTPDAFPAAIPNSADSDAEEGKEATAEEDVIHHMALSPRQSCHGDSRSCTSRRRRASPGSAGRWRCFGGGYPRRGYRRRRCR